MVPEMVTALPTTRTESRTTPSISIAVYGTRSPQFS